MTGAGRLSSPYPPSFDSIYPQFGPLGKPLGLLHQFLEPSMPCPFGLKQLVALLGMPARQLEATGQIVPGRRLPQCGPRGPGALQSGRSRRIAALTPVYEIDGQAASSTSPRTSIRPADAARRVSAYILMRATRTAPFWRMPCQDVT